MSMDLSSLNSIMSLLGTSNGAAATSTQSTSNANFEDFLMNALGGSQSPTKTSDSSLFDLISGSSTTSLLNGLNSSGNTNDIASQLIQSLQTSSTSSTDSSTSLNNLFNSTSSTTSTDSANATDMFASSLTNNFQAQIMKNMSAAKAKLQTNFDGYVQRAGENPTEAAKLRMEQMQQNINTVSNYMTTKSADSSATNQYDTLLSQLTNGTTNTSSLLDQLDAKSSLSQYLLNM